MDTKLLLDMFHIPSQSSKESKMREFLTSYLKSIGISFKLDSVGNIYNISNINKPLLSAHMDTVQDDFDVLMSKFIGIKQGMVKGYGVIGGDDKCGIYAILDLLKNGHTDVNFIFSVEEEVGGIGSSYFEKHNDLTHILYGLILDRRGSGDIICEYNEYGTKHFESTLAQIGTHYGFKPDKGTFSDADNFSEQISCANLSVGYYNAHCKNEYVILSDLQNTINYVHSIVKHLDVKFEAPEKTFSYTGYGWLNGRNHSGHADYGVEEYLYPTETAEMCELCGSTKTPSRLLKTLGFHLCKDCIEDLKWELDGIDVMDDYDYEGRGVM
jgi:putative aminopeptidase FrvX